MFLLYYSSLSYKMKGNQFKKCPAADEGEEQKTEKKKSVKRLGNIFGAV